MLRRFAVAALAITVLAGVSASRAAAAPVNYYGYNYITPSFPTECSAAWLAGCAQYGFNEWDWSGMNKLGGDCVHVGFRDTFGYFYYAFSPQCSEWNGSTFHVSRTGVSAPPYNRPFCGYSSGGQTYGQCWAEVRH